MQYRRLGNTDLEVSVICLGTMTWGVQNTARDAFEQLDYALSQGVNFIDTAELYAIPPTADTFGKTEEIIGEWLTARGGRERLVIATKVAGNTRGWVDYIRGGPRLNREQMTKALEGSLRRLRTDYIDLYQVHWPARTTNYFETRGVTQIEDEEVESIEETLEVLDDFVRQGKVRHIGISNETPWGLMQYLCLARERGWACVQSIQNPYNLLNRLFEVGLSEIALREQVGLLAYSPLGFGVLSGKYLDGTASAEARLNRFPDYRRYSGENSLAATRSYVAIARKHGLSPAQMALAFVNSRPFVTANIVGATTLEQLRENIGSIDVELSQELLDEIETIHQRIPDPAP
ncbi:MAG: NADP(H)-dependent aldo-keto reductase [Gammaproteobacteria bacterium]|nr:MAG: NADP(H)-dependent aldo-keto reductase [Gammaproteobacteria bacterium]